MEGNRDATDEKNKITFFIPIFVLNAEYVVEDLEREITLALEIGDTRLWTALENIKIKGVEEPGEGEATSTTVNYLYKVFTRAYFYNNVSYILKCISIQSTLLNTNGEVKAGDGALYKIEIVVGAESWANIDIVAKGTDDYPVKNVRLATSGTISYIPPVWLVRNVKEDGEIEVRA